MTYEREMIAGTIFKPPVGIPWTMDRPDIGCLTAGKQGSLISAPAVFQRNTPVEYQLTGTR